MRPPGTTAVRPLPRRRVVRARARQALVLLIGAGLAGEARPLPGPHAGPPAASRPAGARDGEREADAPLAGKTRQAAGDVRGDLRGDLQGDALPGATSGVRTAARGALDRGLAWLAARQAHQPDGSLPGPAPIAVTALGALAYMSGGSSPERGPYGRELARAIDYLLACVDLDPDSETFGYIWTGGDSFSKTHGHGFATLALAEAYSMSPRSERGARIERALKAAVQRIEASQGIEGGWYYSPLRVSEHEGSVTICLVQALRAARNSGIRVDGRVIVRAVDYVKRLQTEEGSFRYALGNDRVTVALTAAAISTLNATGTYSGSELANGYDYVFRELAARSRQPKTRVQALEAAEHEHYERLYLAQAFWHHPDPSVYEDWTTAEEQRVVVAQELDEAGRGYWTHGRYGNAYATAMNCLVLALPEGLLPIFQR